MKSPNEQVFLSYARPDEVAARQLYGVLSRAGVQVWFDRDALKPGVVWKTAIRRAIKESRYFIALMSSSSSSRKGFAHTELRQAIDILDEYPEDEVFLIPVRLENCDPPLDRLNELQWVDMFPEWALGEEKLLRFFGAGARKNTSPNDVEGASGGSDLPITPTVRTEGLNRSKRIGDYWSYLRFYGDGTVLTASSSGSPEQVIAWLNPENVFVSRGTRTISGRQISFTATSTQGSVDYEGEIEGELLTLRIHSRINANRSITDYDFVPLR
jgi:TIR domain